MRILIVWFEELQEDLDSILPGLYKLEIDIQ